MSNNGKINMSTLYVPNAARRLSDPPGITDSIRIVLKYRNHDGRTEVLKYSICLHYDFDEFDNIVCVTIPTTYLEELKNHPDVEQVVLDGRISYCIPHY